MPEQHDVKILQWPKTKAALEHHFQLDKPCPVAIVFEEKPAHVVVTATEKHPVHMVMDMDMDMNVRAREPFPVCIRICEPICAVSDYAVDIKLLGQPLLQIAVNGTTKLGDCKDKPDTGRCVDFRGRRPQESVKPPLVDGDITFTPLAGDGTLMFLQLQPPPTPIQLVFSDSGLRMRFATSVANVRLTVVNFGNSVMQVAAFAGGVAVYNATEIVENSPAEISIPVAGIDEVTLRGGSNEAGLVEVCYEPGSAPPPEPEPEPIPVIR